MDAGDECAGLDSASSEGSAPTRSADAGARFYPGQPRPDLPGEVPPAPAP